MILFFYNDDAIGVAYVSRKGLRLDFYFMAKRAIDYAFKSYVLNEHSDLILKAKNSSLYDYAISQLNINGEITPFLARVSDETISSSDLLVECLEKGLQREYKEVLKINHASYYRTQRLKQRIECMLLKGTCLFLTLTFTDDTLLNTTDKERRVAVSRYLKKFNCQYVANIDFGKENHREHYHAVIQCENIDFDSWRKYGNINAERIRNKDIRSDKTKLAKYICKLSNHAIKETTRRSSLIYSR